MDFDYGLNSSIQKEMNYTERKFINGSHLKIFAIMAMLIDHIGYYILDFLDNTHQILFTVAGLDFSPYFITRFIGRSAFPIFAFLIMEGFIHTRNRFKYGRNLMLFALISEIPWNLVHSNQFFYEKQNVFFTLFLGFLTLCTIEKFKNNLGKLLSILILIFATAYFLRADYGYMGVAFITLMYILRSNKMLMTIVGTCVLPQKWIGGLAFIPISFYNGERGFIKNKVAKYSFYAFYPVHLLIIYLIKLYLFGS